MQLLTSIIAAFAALCAAVIAYVSLSLSRADSRSVRDRLDGVVTTQLNSLVDSFKEMKADVRHLADANEQFRRDMQTDIGNIRERLAVLEDRAGVRKQHG